MEAARRATDGDLARLAELAAEAVAEQVDSRGGRVWALREARPLPAGPSLEAALHDTGRLVLAGTIDGTTVGYAAARIEMLRNRERLGIVSDIYVEPGARAVGVGEALLEAVLAWCREQGCSGVDALALPGNRETKNFFEAFGFTARALVVHRQLPAGPV
ncbi:MAG: GNAT family N-acetyltransferase [Acidimicrobiales bacterium]